MSGESKSTTISDSNNNGVSRLRDRSACVLIAEAGVANRMALSEALRSNGFKHIVSMGKTSDALSYMEGDQVDLLVCGVSADEKVNLLNLLKLGLENPELRNLQIIALASPGEEPILIKGYELGMLAHFNKPLSAESAKDSVSHLIRHLEASDWNLSRVSQIYLRGLLVNGHTEALLELEESICRRHPKNAENLYRLAEAQLRKADEVSARSTLWLASQLGDFPEAQNLLAHLNSQHGGLKKAGIKTCVVADGDAAVRTLIGQALKDEQLDDVILFDNGKECWDWLQRNPPPDVLIQEWRLSGLSGAALVQRIRSHGNFKTSVIVASSLVKREDQVLLQEMGVTAHIEKPFTKDSLLNVLSWMIKEEQLCPSIVSLENKIRRLLNAGKHAEAEIWKSKLIDDSKYPEVSRVSLEAEFSYSRREYAKAKNFAIKALKKVSTSHTINVLGKSSFKLRDFPLAISCFERLKLYSPANIEGLCMLAEAKAEVSDFAGAAEEIAAISDIDPDNEKVIETKVKTEIIQGRYDACRELLEDKGATEFVIAYSNNRAVALALSGRLEDAADLYRRCLSFIPSDESHVRGIVAYNLCLALCRAYKTKEAYAVAKSVEFPQDQKGSDKRGSLVRRLEKAMAAGKSLQFAVASYSQGKSFENLDEILGREEPENQDMKHGKCSHGLFKSRIKSDIVDSMLGTALVLSSRYPIKKG